MSQAQNRFSAWLAQPSLEAGLKQELSAMAGNESAIEDAFGCALTFGTGGLRGVLGAGTNRINVHVVRRAAQAVADYVLTSSLPRRAAIGYDSRLCSERFARETACVLAANGITAHIYPRLEPVPALSFAMRVLSCGVGICITASHNPAQYNGFKVYGPDGCQLTPNGVAQIASNLAARSYFDNIKSGNFDYLLAQNRIQWIPDAILDSYVDAVLSLRTGKNDLANLHLVYTPLNGSGLECAQKLFQKLGVRHLRLVKEQAFPDGHFPTCPYPNPELPEAMALGLSDCETLQPDLLIGTDPDCDRCGVAAPDKTGRFRLLTGNEVGVLLFDFICRRRLENGTMPEKPVCVTTIVSTDMAEPIARHYGVELRRTLTGFKYVGEQIGLLEREGCPERFLFGFEESCGYLSGTHVRDKDGLNAVLLVCEAASWYQARGMTLADAVDALYEAYGFYACGLESFTFSGSDAMAQMTARMRALRNHPPKAIAGSPVSGIVDYLSPETGLPSSDVLAFHLASNAKLIVRPSGTEPKLKCYLSARSDTRAQADALLLALKDACRSLLQ